MIVLGCGNPSRGDDALGHVLLERISQLVGEKKLDVTMVEEFQFQIENVLDLVGHSRCLFVDARVNADSPFRFERVLPLDDKSFTTHSLSPWGLLHVFETTQNQAAPPSYLLSVSGVSFELGDSLSTEALANLELAWSFLSTQLLENDGTPWDSFCTPRPHQDAEHTQHDRGSYA